MELRATTRTAERTRKQKDLSRDELRTLWDCAIERDERLVLQPTCGTSPRKIQPMKTSASAWRMPCNGPRNICSTETPSCLECQVWQEALGRARGETFLGV